MDQKISLLARDLQEKAYITIPFPISRQQLNEAMGAFMAYLDLPDTQKHHIDFKLSKHHRRGDVGFKHRSGQDSIYDDSKDFFHYHPQIQERYSDFLDENPIVNDFMMKAKPIWDAVYQAMESILTEFEAEFPGVTSQVIGQKDDHIILRFLKYNWQSSGKYLAKPHYDAGSFTMCLAESDPGLRIGTCPEDLKPVVHEDGQALFMLSSNFKKIIDSDEYKAGWHDVIQTNDELVGQPYARWAIVAFIEARGVEALSREETHKWYTAEAV